MAIDRIGKGGGVPPTTGDAGVARPNEAARPFEVKRSERPAAPDAVTAATASPLERLRAGQIDVAGYLDMKVDEATTHLHGLRPDALEHIKKTLREQMATDPALADLVKQATGADPVGAAGASEPTE